MSIESCLYRGEVYHKRFRPTTHALKYRVFTLFVDLSELPALDSNCRLFAYNRFNLFSFKDSDVGEGLDESLEYYVKRKLQSSGIAEAPARIVLSCYPRVLGFAFNPLSLFYCFNKDGEVFAIVHEVHNTFGERHCYVLPCERKTYQGADKWIHQAVGKSLFVSPFAHMGMRYSFRVNVPGERQVITIRTHDLEDNDDLLLTAGYSASRLAFTDYNLLRLFLTLPGMSVKVVAGIHWEALKLYLKKVPLFKHQPKAST